MTYMIMDARDRERLGELLRPYLQASGEELGKIAHGGLCIAVTHRDPEKRVPLMITEARAAIDALERIYVSCQKVHDDFEPAYPLVPLVDHAKVRP